MNLNIPTELLAFDLSNSLHLKVKMYLQTPKIKSQDHGVTRPPESGNARYLGTPTNWEHHSIHILAFVCMLLYVLAFVLRFSVNSWPQLAN